MIAQNLEVKMKLGEAKNMNQENLNKILGGEMTEPQRRCSHYEPKDSEGFHRCSEFATVVLQSEGKNVPGALCQLHAQIILDEYKEKLHEIWTAIPIEQEGK